MRKRTLDFMLFAGLGATAALWIVSISWHGAEVERALRAAGYGEHVTRPGDPKACPPRATSTAFIAQGGRRGRETQGHVCTSLFASATVSEGAPGNRERLDWH